MEMTLIYMKIKLGNKCIPVDHKVCLIDVDNKEDNLEAP